MCSIRILVIFLSVVLFSGTIFVAHAVPTTTVLALDPVPPLILQDEKITFVGALRTSDGVGLTNKTVQIVEQRATEAIVLATVFTDQQGNYETTWTAQLNDSKQKVRLTTILAIFDGDESYSASKSSPMRIKITIKNWIVVFNTDKDTYNMNEVATFTIKFFDRINAVDPDSITSIYDGNVVNLTRVGEGVYTYKTAELRPRFHTLEIVAEKGGFEEFSAVKEITVLEIEDRVRAAEEDYIAPKSNVTINGLYNGDTDWYYGHFPVAVFNATDEHFGKPSGIFHIVVQYMSKYGDQRCSKNAVCYLQPGENMTLSRYNSVNHGEIQLRWFAKDNGGNLEEPNKMRINVDTVPPRVSVLKISTDSNENISIGSYCKNYRIEERFLHCSIIHAFTNETIIFRVLAHDLISGVKSAYYRVVPYTSVIDAEWNKLETNSTPFPHSISFGITEIGTYRFQLRAEDNAGNESPIKEFLIYITRPLAREFALSVQNFDVTRDIDKSGNLYYNISALVTNVNDKEIAGTASVLVQQRNGVTVHIEIQEIVFGSQEDSNISVQWRPDRIDVYKIKMFIWDAAAGPLTDSLIYDQN